MSRAVLDRAVGLQFGLQTDTMREKGAFLRRQQAVRLGMSAENLGLWLRGTGYVQAAKRFGSGGHHSRIYCRRIALRRSEPRPERPKRSFGLARTRFGGRTC